jgi:O-antigen ligase
LVSLYALLQYLGLDFFLWSETPSVTGRAFSSLGQPNFLGHFLAINIPIIIFSLVFLTKKKFYKFLVFLVLLLNLSALVISLSRAAWLALFFGLIFSFLVFLIIKKKKALVV